MTVLHSALNSRLNSRQGRQNCLRLRLIAVFGLVCSLFAASAAHAAGVVSVPTEAALDVALQGGGLVTFACDGTIPITTTKTLTVDTIIDAAGHNITLDGGGQHSLFNVTGTAALTEITPYTLRGYTISHVWVPTYANLSLNNLTLANGAASNLNGGGVALVAANLTATNCAFRGNSATVGGAVNNAPQTFTSSYIVGVAPDPSKPRSFIPVYSSAFSGSLIISDSKFDSNTATIGGALNDVSAASADAVTRCAFTNNRAVSTTFAAGGAVGYISHFTDCAFTNNQAAGDNSVGDGAGGAAYECGVFTNCVFTNNQATGNHAQGGATYESGGFTNCTFTNNQVTGVFAEGGAICEKCDLTNCAFTSNQATGPHGSGGAVYSLDYSVNATNCVFSGNSAQCDASNILLGGGAIYAGTAFLTNCACLNNQCIGGSGGALYCELGYITLKNSVFAGNAASGSSGTTYSPAVCGGGAIYVYATPAYDSLTITGCAFLNNHLAAGARCSACGGAISLMGEPATSITNCTFAGNSAIGGSSGDAQGAALYFSGAACTLTNCTVANNVAAGGQSGNGGGGGVYNGAGTLTLVNTLVANNRADYQSNAGGVGVADGGHNLCSDSSAAFTSASSFNNTDPRLGPLVYTGNATPTLSLMAGSPAIDAGDDTKAPATDQRGASRQGSHSDIGAYERPIWQADSLAVGPDAKTRLLWNKNNGSTYLWNVDTTAGTYNVFYQGGPFSAGTATNLTVGGDNNTNLLLQNTNGRALLRRVDTTTGAVLNEHSYGPNPGWTANSMTVGSDNKQRVLWNNLNGSTYLWNVDASSGNIVWGAFYDVIPNWTPTALAVGADGNLRVLWNNTSGQMFLWSLNTTSGQLVSGATFGPVAGWTATNIACGRDNNIRVLWQNVSGQTFLWSVDTNTQQIVSGCTFAPRTGWNAAGIAVGDDNNTRLLWQRIDGETQLWNVDAATGNILSTQDFGPLN